MTAQPLLFDDTETFPLFAGTPVPAEPATFQPQPAWVQEQIAYAYSPRKYDTRAPQELLAEALRIKHAEVLGMIRNRAPHAELVDACACRDALSDYLWSIHPLDT